MFLYSRVLTLLVPIQPQRKTPHAAGSASAAKSSEKRKQLEEQSATSKRQRVSRREQQEPVAEALPPTITATLPINGRPSPNLMSAARDCWYHVAPCESEDAPADIPREQVVADDLEYQASKPFNSFQQPLSQRVRCILCL